MQRNKIITVKDLNDLSGQFIQEKGRKVLVGGCFDILHFGHIKFLREAKKFGDILIVALESDRNVQMLKGDNRPFQSVQERGEILSELISVDYIISLPPMISDNEYYLLVQKVSPQVIAITEGDKIIEKKREHARKVGAKLEIIPQLKTASTSQLAKTIGLE